MVATALVTTVVLQWRSHYLAERRLDSLRVRTASVMLRSERTFDEVWNRAEHRIRQWDRAADAALEDSSALSEFEIELLARGKHERRIETEGDGVINDFHGRSPLAVIKAGAGAAGWASRHQTQAGQPQAPMPDGEDGGEAVALDPLAEAAPPFSGNERRVEPFRASAWGRSRVRLWGRGNRNRWRR
jgi:hypothetical protein